MCLFDYLKQSQTWNTSFSCTGAVGSIKRWLKFFNLLVIRVTWWIFLSLAQWFTCWKHCTINKVASALFPTIPCDNSLIHPIGTIVVSTNIDNCYDNNIKIQKWLLRAIKILALNILDGCVIFKKNWSFQLMVFLKASWHTNSFITGPNRPINSVKSRGYNKTPKIFDQDIKDYVHIWESYK